jgi:acyl carrier protein
MFDQKATLWQYNIVFSSDSRNVMSGRVERIFAEVLGVPVDLINDESSPETLQKWDSAAVIDLILAIEDEFRVRLSTKEIITMRSIALVKKVLASKGLNDV